MRAFFEAELGWDASCPALTTRTAAVEAALGRISRLSRDYDLALTLVAAAGAGLDAAVTALAALHESAGGGGPDGTWDALPELGLLRAQAHVQRAAAVGWCPAGAPLRGLDPDPCTLACTIITPGRARVAPAVADVPRRAQIDVATERVMAHLLLAGARARGVPDADLAGTEACLAYLEGAPERAAQALERIGVGASARARAALRDNRRLFALQSWLLIRDVTARPSRDELLALASTWAWDDTPARAALAVWLDPARRSKAKAEPSPPTPGSAWQPAALCAGDTCLRVRAGPSMLELAPLALDASGRRLATWTSACDLAAPVVTYEGATRVAARCGEPATDWVLELMGDDVRAATALRTTP